MRENNSEITAILIGLILGDGCITKSTKRQKESHLMLHYSDRYLSYLEWLHKRLLPIGMYPIKPKKGYLHHECYSRPLKGLGYLRQLFYPNGVKIIPDSIQELLISPLSLAVWYMDDGSLDYRAKYHANATIASYNFSLQDCQGLSNVLLKNFQLDVRVHQSKMRGKIYYRLYFTSGSTRQFLALIEPYMLACFSHKLLHNGASSRGNT